MMIVGLKYLNITNPLVGYCTHIVGASHMIYTLFNGLLTHTHYVNHDEEPEVK